MTNTTKYPLYFQYSGLAEGQTFLANVRILGRALIEEGDDTTWFFGVNPSCLAEDAEDYAMAYHAFRSRLVDIIAEMAAESDDCKQFTEKVNSLVKNTSQVAVDDWNEARQSVRKNEALRQALPLEHITEPKPPEVYVSLLAGIREADSADDEDGNLDESAVPIITRPQRFALAANTELANAA